MPKLNQILAIEKGIKTETFQKLTETHHQLQKNALMSGISKTYQPRDEEGEALPPEFTKVQVNAENVLKETRAVLAKLFDVTATKDWANCTAKADIVVDGQTILEGVPATYLLFLEKQLTDINTFVRKLPLLDSAENWTLDTADNTWKTAPVETIRTKKVPRNHVKAEATEKHPAQVEVYMEDVPVGRWRTVKMSGALPANRVTELADRVEKLQAAVKFAREEANSAKADDVTVSEKLFRYLFG
jgi:hypothetical protein